MDDVECVGNEASILDCPHSTQDDCNGEEGAGVFCDGMPMKCHFSQLTSKSNQESFPFFHAGPGQGSDTDLEFCSSSNRCTYMQGHCDNDDECVQDHICGDKNCRNFWNNAEPTTNCCIPGK